jgi:hypothetical protein
MSDSLSVLNRILKMEQKKEGYYYRFKFLFVSIMFFIILIAIIDDLLNKVYGNLIILISAEFIMLIASFLLFKLSRNKFKNLSRIIDSLFKTENVTQILIKDYNIKFIFNNNEHQSIIIRNKRYRTQIIENLKSVFGESKLTISQTFKNFKMSTLNELKKSILADGIIDEQEVILLREALYEDGVIDKEEAEFLFELNDAVSGKENHSSWQTLFIDAITSFLLDDEASPGVVDEHEAAWLLEKIQGDGKLDGIELALLKNLKAKAKNLPQSLLNLL